MAGNWLAESLAPRAAALCRDRDGPPSLDEDAAPSRRWAYSLHPRPACASDVAGAGGRLSVSLEEGSVKITLTSEESVRLEPTIGPLTIEAPETDRLYSPFHMLGSSLGFCTYSILASWASHAGIASDGLVIDVAWTFAEDPHRVGELHVSFAWPELPANRRAAAQRVAALCSVHGTLSHSPTITIALAATAAAAPTAAPGADAPAERADVVGGGEGADATPRRSGASQAALPDAERSP